MDEEMSRKDKAFAWFGVAVITVGYGLIAYATVFVPMGWWMK